MDIQKVYSYSENAKATVSVNERLLQCAKSLDRFLDYLQKNKPEIFDKYRLTLRKQLSSLITKPTIDLGAIVIPHFQDTVQKHEELQKLYITYAFQLLEIPEDFSSENTVLLWSNSDRSGYYPFYHRALALCEVLGRDQAIHFLKEYIDRTTYEQTQPNLKLDDVNHFWEEDTREKENPPPQDIVAFRFHKGKVGARVDRCRVHEAMKPLNDPELAYIIACYGDTALIAALNPHFVLTRTKTLMQGHPYCDACVHDKRHVFKIEHPRQDFYRNLDSKPENETS